MTLPKELSSSRTAPSALATGKVESFLRKQIANGKNEVMILFSFVDIMKRHIWSYCPWGRGWGGSSSVSEEKVFSVNSSSFLHFIRQSLLSRDELLFFHSFHSSDGKRRSSTISLDLILYFLLYPFPLFILLFFFFFIFNSLSLNRNIPTLLTD